jgi:hypothetical protein
MPRPWTEDELARIDNARRIWDEAQDLRGTLAEIYLRQVRQLELPDELAGKVLRFHPRCPWRSETTGCADYLPALIAAFRSIDDNTITAVHRVGLNSDGTKLGRRMLGIVTRAAVKLDAINGDTLTIGEGVETAMAARELGFMPAWALGSAGSISFFPLIDAVKTLTILGERDKGNTDAIHICKARWRRAGRRVLNDVLATKKATS